jgi:hypothetical protein
LFVLFLTVGIVFVNRWTLLTIYKRNASVQAMLEISTELERRANLVASVEAELKAHEQTRANLQAHERAERAELSKRESNLRTAERTERGRIEKERTAAADSISRRIGVKSLEEADALNGLTTSIGSKVVALDRQISDINRQEAENLSAALKLMQDLFIERELKRERITAGTIPGIGPKFAARLHAAGIYSAAEADMRRVYQVEGFGRSKTHTLDRWRNGILSKAKSKMPASLNLTDDSTIRAKFSSKRVVLEQQRDAAQRLFLQGEKRIRDQYARERLPLESEMLGVIQVADKALGEVAQQYRRQYAELADITTRLVGKYGEQYGKRDMQKSQAAKRLLEEKWDYSKSLRMMDAYRGLSFGNYVRLVLLGRRR